MTEEMPVQPMMEPLQPEERRVWKSFGPEALAHVRNGGCAWGWERRDLMDPFPVCRLFALCSDCNLWWSKSVALIALEGSTRADVNVTMRRLHETMFTTHVRASCSHPLRQFGDGSEGTPR